MLEFKRNSSHSHEENYCENDITHQFHSLLSLGLSVFNRCFTVLTLSTLNSLTDIDVIVANYRF